MSVGSGTELIGLTAPFKVGSGGVTKGAAVILDSSGDVVLATAITDQTIGVALATKSQGDSVSVQTSGIAQMVCSAAIAIGAECMVTSSGAGKVSTASGATARTMGVCLTTGANDGEGVSVLLACPAVKRPPNS